MYKQAIFSDLKIQTSKGVLNVIQLTSLSINELDKLAVELEAVCESGGKKSFLTSRSTEDKTAKLRFDLVLDILNTKIELKDNALKQSSDKEHNQKIMALIKNKQEKSLEEKSIEELEALIIK